eukprot:5312762-Pleurochrysis_carterae.AAC.1
MGGLRELAGGHLGRALAGRGHSSRERGRGRRRGGRARLPAAPVNARGGTIQYMGDGAGGGGGARRSPDSHHLGGRPRARGGHHERRIERSAANAGA